MSFGLGLGEGAALAMASHDQRCEIVRRSLWDAEERLAYWTKEVAKLKTLAENVNNEDPQGGNSIFG